MIFLKICVVSLLANLVETFTPKYYPRIHQRLSQQQITRLHSLDKSLNEVEQQFDLTRTSGPTSLNFNEILSAEKSVQSAILSAEKAVVETGTGDTIPKITTNMDLVNTMKAAEIVADAAATSVKADALGMNDLAVASKDVVESIKASETAVQSVIDKISAGSNVDGSDVELLEKSASDLMKAMEVAQSIATNVGQSAVNDALSLQKLESMGYGLIQNINDAGKLMEDKQISGDLEAAAIDILEEMQSSEEIATDVAKLAIADSNTVFSLDIEVNSIIDAIRFIEAGIKQYMTKPSIESKDILQRFANEALELIKMDEINADIVTEAVMKDSEIDSKTIDTLKLADIGIDELVKAADVIFKDETKANVDLVSKVVDQMIPEATMIIESTSMSMDDTSNIVLSIQDTSLNESLQSSIDHVVSSVIEFVPTMFHL